MENNCIMCLTLAHSENDIAKQQIEKKPVPSVIEELFGLKIDAADRRRRELPHKVCPACIVELTTAYKLRLQYFETLDITANWEKNHEPGEVYSADDVQHNENLAQEVSMDFPIDVKEESIVGSDSEPSEEVDIKKESVVGTDTDEDNDLQSKSDNEQNVLEASHDHAETVPKATQKKTGTISRKDRARSKATEKVHRCDICDKTFTQSGSMMYHKLRIHSDEMPFKCRMCPKAFKFKSNVNRHEMIHMDNQFSCDLCGKKCKLKQNLKEHILRMHAERKPYECQICHMQFKSESTCQYHKRAVHKGDSKKLSCDICGLAFFFKYALRKHLLQVHTEDRPFECKICHKTYKTSIQVQYHQVVHSEDKPFSCDVCGKKFKSEKNTQLHKLVHSQDRAFSCGSCDKTFKTRKDLTGHSKRVHSLKVMKKYSHVCDICKKSFKAVNSLKAHIQRNHNNKKPEM